MIGARGGNWVVGTGGGGRGARGAVALGSTWGRKVHGEAKGGEGDEGGEGVGGPRGDGQARGPGGTAEGGMRAVEKRGGAREAVGGRRMMELVQVWNLACLQAIDAVKIAPISGAHSTPSAFDVLYSM